MLNFEVYTFSNGETNFPPDVDDKTAKNTLGGKGIGLVRMTQAGFSVPPGFIIPTTACNEFRALQDGADLGWWIALKAEIMAKDAGLKKHFGFAPLVAVRSGAPISMPGMMDTILNVGLNDANLNEWQKRIGDRAALDSYRRLIQMLGHTAYGIAADVFENILALARETQGVKTDAELSVFRLEIVVDDYLHAFQKEVGYPFPQDRNAQLDAAIKAVFDSWMNPRAIEYRRINKIDEAMGTAVNVQAMVFGNMGEDSGTGVLFTRNPSTGEPGISGEFLPDAQGEDVVAGIRTPFNVSLMTDLGPGWHSTYMDLKAACFKLEEMYRDMVDLEFTVQQGHLYILQSRTGKRSARAAFKIATDMVREGVINRAEARSRLTVEQLKVVTRPTIDPAYNVAPDFIGLPACPGVVTGIAVRSSEEAVKLAATGAKVILVTHETTPDDIAGMNAAVGILTKTGGATSHAAVVARAMDRVCVVGCTSIVPEHFDGHKVTLDGSTGRVWVHKDVPVIDSSEAPELREVMDWCLEYMGCCDNSLEAITMDRPHTVMAADFWGSTELAVATLAELAELPDCKHITLDCNSPHSFVPEDDKLVDQLFGTDTSAHEFKETLIHMLVNDHGALQGLRLTGLDAADMAQMKALGYKEAKAGPHGAPVSVPAQYAAFYVLGQ